MEMKPMEYRKQRCCEVLFQGEHKAHKFCILNLGTHPTAYVECKLKNLTNGYGSACLDGVSVHWGFTYFGGGKAWGDPDTKYLGWDYAHCDDWAGYLSDMENEMFCHRKYSTPEIWEEVQSVIDQLIPIEEAEK